MQKALWARRDFRAQHDPQPGTLPEHRQSPSISILKAVKGLDPGLAEALRTHCTQDYPAPFELLFAVHSLSDPAMPTLHALAREFPHLRIEVIATPLILGTNGKISNLAQLLPLARHELILISDADIAVAPGYLRRITAPFAGPFEGRETGLVTALYFGRTQPAGRPTLGSRLEALTLSTDFIPGVLTARYTERGMRFALGATLLVSRPALAAAGGLEGLTSVLADDHALGQRVAAAGYRVVLSPEPVSTSVPAYTFPEFWGHQLRWARTVRDARPGGYFGLVFTQPVPWAFLYIVASGLSLFSIVLLLCAMLARMSVAISIGLGSLRDTRVLRDLPLLPWRDCIGLVLWSWSYAGNTVEWRGERFRVHHGKLLRIHAASPVAGADLQ
jgi:ceramide glucosyltransferase